jgi:hypothetical protein
MNGFLGTGATFRADFNLVVQITMGLAPAHRSAPGETKTVSRS